MIEVKSPSETNIKQNSPKIVSSSPKLGRKSSWKEVNALLKNSYSFANINSDFTFGSSPKRGDTKHTAVDSESEDTHSSSIRATESLGSIDWNYKSDVSVLSLTSRSIDTYGSKVSTDNFNFEKDTSFGGVAFRNPHMNDSFDDCDIQKVETVEDDDEEEVESNDKLVKVIDPDEESIVLRSRGNWVGGESLSTNKLVLLLSDMQVQLKNTASFLLDTEEDYQTQRVKEGERLKAQLLAGGESVPDGKKLLRTGVPKMARSGSPARTAVVVPSYDDSKSIGSTVSANSTRSRGKSSPSGRKSPPKRTNSNGSNSGLTLENLARRNAAAAAAAAAKNGEGPNYLKRTASGGALSPEKSPARGREGFASPQRGRTVSPQRRASGTGPTAAAASRDSSTARKPATATASTPGKPAPLVKSTSSVLPGTKNSVRSSTPTAAVPGRSRSVEPAARSASTRPGASTAATTTTAGSKRSATPTGRSMGTGSRKLNEPIKKEPLTPLVEKPPIPKTPVKTPSKESSASAAADKDKRFPSPEKKAATKGGSTAAAVASAEKPSSRTPKVSLKAPIPTLSELKIATPKRKSLPGSTTPGKPTTTGAAGAPSPAKQATRRASTGGAATGAAASGAAGGAAASGKADGAAATVPEKSFLPPGATVYVPPQPEIYLSVLTHSTPNVIATMFTKCGPSNSNTRAAAFAPPTMDALEEIIKKVMEERTNAEAAAAAAAAAASGETTADSSANGMTIETAAETTETVDKILYATPSKAALLPRRSASVERLGRPKSDLHVWPSSAEPSVDGSTSSGNVKSPLKSTRSSAPMKPRFSVI